jgi:single-stranded-DNA-specific exonuclease
VKKWTERTFEGSLANLHYFSRTFNVHPFIMKTLFSRGMINGNTISKFLFPSISDLHDPFLLNDMKPAIQRTIQAIRNKEKIVIYGDYDVDGITSTSIMKKALDFFQGNVHAELPLREHGYGITVSAIERLKAKHQPSLIITVDNGSNAHEALRYAKKEGIDVIVTDHHEILDYHPSCYAFINPKRSDNTYPFTELSGAGVAFKFAHALFSCSKFPWEKHIWDFAELACLGTIADMMKLIGENRIIASIGIQKLNNAPSPTFQELFRLLSVSHVDSGTIGFTLAPIFNSIGRIDDPNIGCTILANDEKTETTLFHLIETNKKRKWLTYEQTMQAESIISQKQLFAKNIIVVAGDFHDGIIGIIAARITNKYKKPSIVISKNGKGSARSIGQFSIINTI